MTLGTQLFPYPMTFGDSDDAFSDDSLTLHRHF